jgi:bacillithiol system protein YtxJ
MNWNNLETIAQLDAIEKESFQIPVAIFKHSTRCHISRAALRMFENELNLKEEIAPYFLDLLEYRNVSNEIAIRFGVPHQSPQLIVIKDGKAIYNASHERIDAAELEQFV